MRTYVILTNVEAEIGYSFEMLLVERISAIRPF